MKMMGQYSRIDIYGSPINNVWMSKMDALIERVNAVIDGGVRMADLAKYLGKSWSQCSEWVRTRRYTPNAEVALAMQDFCAIHEPMLNKKIQMEKREDGSVKLTMDGKELSELEQELWFENHAMRQLVGAKL